MPGVALLEFSGPTRGLDIFWDNVFTDLLVRDEIKRCKRSVWKRPCHRVEQMF